MNKCKAWVKVTDKVGKVFNVTQVFMPYAEL